MKQLLLFEESLEGKLLREVSELKESLNKIRKGQFAKIGELTKKYNDLRQEFDIINAALCQQSKAALHEKTRCEIIELSLI